MAYDPVAQADRDVLSEGSNSVASGSPPPNESFRPISMDFENLGGSLSMEAAKEYDDGEATRLGSIMRSMASTGTSYDIIEDEDYEDAQETPVKKNAKGHGAESSPVNVQSPLPHSTSLQRVRTASIGKNLPLRHPTPDLQSVQGAYVKNVERLEESAERLSMTSSLEDELLKMKSDQRRKQRQSSAPVGNSPSVHTRSRQVSGASLSNPNGPTRTSARAGGHPTSGAFTSPRGSIRSGSWSHTSNQERPTSKSSRFAQPLSERDLGRISAEWPRQASAPRSGPPQPPPHTYYPGNPARRISTEHSHPPQNVEEDDEVRPSTAASNDTYRQATNLFVDFDGVHFTSHLSPSRQGSVKRQFAIDHPPLAVDSAAFNEPPPGEQMVYYPAPVPMMLNLPQKLSKLPSAAERERRRLKALSSMPSEMRKSAAWLNENGKPTSAKDLRTSQALSNLPSQLRATAFFDHPGVGQEVDIKGASAVDTLDSILDASAHAPVSAFTDHPFAGHLGGEVYGTEKGHRKSATLERKKKRRSSITKLLRTSTGLNLENKMPRPGSAAGVSTMPQNKLVKRRSRVDMNEGEAALASGEEMPLRTSGEFHDAAEEAIKPEEDELEEAEEEEGEGDEDEEEEQDLPAYSGPPTTLLAELQMRKAQQRLRNRTAATNFPKGMHSTLLELDAVAQFQQKSRNKKHITLAWEDQEVADQENFDDDDVPLGLLVAGQKAQQNVNRPIGLMEKREMEDNEPLSRRRARLRGDDVARPGTGPSEQQRASTMYTLDIPGLEEKPLDEKEEETLAQRIQRIKAEKGTATGLSTGLSRGSSGQHDVKAENVAPTPPAEVTEETLGQRRKRLREEALKNSRQPSGGSSQNVLGLKARSSMADILAQHPAAGARKPSNEAKVTYSQVGNLRTGPQPNHRATLMSNYQPPLVNTSTMSGMIPGMMPLYPSFNGAMPYMNGIPGFNYNAPIMYSPGLAMQTGGYNHNNYLHDQIAMGPPLDPKQRDMIDRWRQGVAQ
jgi:hypothetical protein